ncbi:Ff.00g042170.m01.CDS01 [Fusarium sp. VM40]|nr:Ff.00g042170.m01.CDS01 [Fusarium sp. VM40]
MRVLSFALAFFAADIVVEAGVCKPARTTTAQSVLTSSVESSATAVSTAVTETSVVSAESLTSATETVIPTSSIETLTSSITLAGTTTTELLSTATTEEASTTTTEQTATTTTADAGPVVTSGSIIGTGPFADLTLKGNGQRFTPLSFAPSDSTQTLIFSLVNNQLSAGNNNYLCLTYKDVGVLGPLVLCPFDNFSSAPLKCSQTSSGTLSCTAPNGSCNASGTCRRPNNAALFY